MNKIIIDPHCCSDEEYRKLKDYLTNNTWDWQEVSSGESLQEDKKEAFGFCAADIQWCAKDRGLRIPTETEANDILDFISAKADSSVGVSWDTIEFWTDKFFNKE